MAPSSYVPEADPLTRLADGTIKQVNPFTGTQVWTVPGRGHRPLNLPEAEARPIDRAAHGRYCALCHERYLETPPEKARLVRVGAGAVVGGEPATDRALADGTDAAGGFWRTVPDLPADRLFEQAAEFRRIPNLFEILSYDYWHANYGFTLPEAREASHAAYLASPTGRAHLESICRTRLVAGGLTPWECDTLGEAELLRPSWAFFGGGHELIVARRHFRDDATDDDGLAGSGTLSPEEHFRYTAFTVDALRAVYAGNRYVRYVAVFQNWLKPAGASFDHLHKQLAAIDERGRQVEAEVRRVRENPNIYNEAAVNYAGYHNLLVAENEHAVALAGFGHRYPSLEVYSKSEASAPWEHTQAQIRGVSDLVHACHAATGANVPTNEEWHHRPADVEVPMPWRIVLKWRVSNLAGFEGGTKIYLNTIDPWALRERVLARLRGLRARGTVAADLALGEECPGRPNSLRYAR